MTPLDVVQSIVGARSEVERTSILAVGRHRLEGVIKSQLDLVILVVAEGKTDQGQDLGELVDVVQSADILNLFRGDRHVDRVSGGDLHGISADLPRDGAGLEHSRAGVEAGIQLNSRDDAMDSSQSELVLHHIAGDDILVFLLGGIVSLVTAIDDNRLSDGTIILTISHVEVQMRGNPDFKLLIGVDRLVGLGVDVAFSEGDLHLDSRDVGLDREILVTSAAQSSNNVGGLNFGQSHLNLSEGSGGVDSSTHLVLLLPHINLLTIRGDKGTSLHGDRELRVLSDDLRNSTLVEDVVHKNILMNGERHTNDGVEGTKVGILGQDGRTVIIILSLSHFTSIINQGSILTQSSDLTSDEIRLALDEEVLQSLIGLADHQGLGRLREHVNTRLIQNILNALLVGSCKLLNGIISVTAAHTDRGITITNNRHC